MRYEVVVVGAGAAGILAAARAAERGRRTLLVEKNKKPGAKVLMSGGTRCNITHATDAQGIIGAFGKAGRFLHSALAALGPADLVALVEAEGVPTKVESTGKIFPASNRAADVLAALLRRLGRSGCDLATVEPLVNLTRRDDAFALTTPHRTLAAEKVIITTGGKSYPGCGTTGDGYAWLAALGHTIVPPRPALTPITTAASWVAALRGVTIPDVDVELTTADEPRGCLAEARGSFLFTHFGLSGPAVLNISRGVTAHPRPQDLLLRCDFLPSIGISQWDAQVRQRCADEGKKRVSTILAHWLPRRLVESLLDSPGLPDRLGAEVTRDERQRIVQAVKSTLIPISGTRGFRKAEVTAGGVALDEIDSRTMESKLVPGLYLAGEILDLDGPIGGYNFQAAFSEGWLAGGSA